MIQIQLNIPVEQYAQVTCIGTPLETLSCRRPYPLVGSRGRRPNRSFTGASIRREVRSASDAGSVHSTSGRIHPVSSQWNVSACAQAHVTEHASKLIAFP